MYVMRMTVAGVPWMRQMETEIIHTEKWKRGHAEETILRAEKRGGARGGEML